MSLHASLSHPRDGERGSIAISQSRRVTAAALAAMAGLFALALGSVLTATGGAFNYTLDDPYIHLSMAEQILRGEYGINPGEPAAAASSVLYPYLLAALMALGIGDLGPLVLNAAALVVSTLCLVAILDEVAGAPAPGRVAARAFLIVTLCLALNLTGLAFSGMENGIHTALCLAGLLGLLRCQRLGRPPLWWLAVLLATPLMRYEGLSLLFAGAVVLALNRHRAAALAVTATALLGLAAFSLYLHGLGLPLLPSSVLVKGAEAGVSGTGSLLTETAFNFMRNLQTRDGLIVALLLAALLARLVGADGALRRTLEPAWQVAFMGSTVLAGQLVLGRFPTFNRYSAYALAIGIAAVIVVYARPTRFILRQGRVGLVAGVGLLIATVFSTSLMQGFLTGTCAGNIYLQQYQTHRFVTEFWKSSIAVNDLGWPSYRNENYVLDLWGLGSEKARLLRRSPDVMAGLASLARDKQVRAAAIYDTWFLTRPPGWVPVARMTLDIRLVSADSETVTFYATQADSVPALREALEAFGRTLPTGASLRMVSEPAGGPI